MHGPSDIMRHERWQWAMVQKQERGLYLLDAHLKHDMARQNVKPNIWVFPPKMSIYATMVPNAETEYRMRGPKAATNLDADRYTLPSFRGCKVVESNSFDVDFTGQPINLLERNRQIGEFFIMENGKDIMIYDAGKDGWAKISWENAAKAAYGVMVLRIRKQDLSQYSDLMQPGPCPLQFSQRAAKSSGPRFTANTTWFSRQMLFVSFHISPHFFA